MWSPSPERVPVDEAVVEVVVDGRREDAVETEDAGLLVPLVLVAAAARNLDDDLDDVGELAGGRAHGRPRGMVPSLGASRRVRRVTGRRSAGDGHAKRPKEPHEPVATPRVDEP